jgi:hypothetical protein
MNYFLIGSRDSKGDINDFTLSVSYLYFQTNTTGFGADVAQPKVTLVCLYN